ncbi:MAG: family 78 glycoside hydrolase catalytic domain, partial [Bacteroidales bacterium]
MKRLAGFLWILLLTIAAEAQEFIGCNINDAWVETPKLRKSFMLSKAKTVTLDVVSLGYHEVYINGQRVGDCVMQPAVSQLNKRALKVSYDVTSYVHPGENTILLWIGQGWGRIYNTPAVAQAKVFTEDALIAQTDGTWQASQSGYSYTGSWQPLQFGGERFDAHVEDDWQPAKVLKVNDIIISNQEFGGNHIIDTLHPINITQESENTLLLDFGRALTGWFQVDFLPLSDGHEVTMQYLDHLKSADTESDVYVSKGDGEDHFTNRFHTHSFRYVHITGCKGIRQAKAMQ